MIYKTLLEQREAELKELVDTILVRAETLKKCVEGGYSDVDRRVLDIAYVALDAKIAVARVNDLRDVEKYGPRGGR